MQQGFDLEPHFRTDLRARKYKRGNNLWSAVSTLKDKLRKKTSSYVLDNVISRTQCSANYELFYNWETQMSFSPGARVADKRKSPNFC